MADIDYIVRFLRSYSSPDVKQAIKQWSQLVLLQEDRAIELAKNSGWELITCPPDALVFDGRPVMRVGNKSLVMSYEMFDERLANAIHEDAPAVVLNNEEEFLTTMSCPKCGDKIQSTSVCAGCALGSAGIRYKYSCSCGLEFFSKEQI